MMHMTYSNYLVNVAGWRQSQEDSLQAVEGRLAVLVWSPGSEQISTDESMNQQDDISCCFFAMASSIPLPLGFDKCDAAIVLTKTPTSNYHSLQRFCKKMSLHPQIIQLQIRHFLTGETQAL